MIPFVEGAPPEHVSPGGDLAYTIVNVPGETDRPAKWGTDLRGAVHGDTPQGLEFYVTGACPRSSNWSAIASGGRRG